MMSTQIITLGIELISLGVDSFTINLFYSFIPFYEKF